MDEEASARELESVGVSLGDVLGGKYAVESVIGRGGMGVVLAARHVALGEIVAVKLMRIGSAKSKESIARFMREARSAAKIKSEHVVRVSDVGALETGQPYLVMELLEGGDLRQVLEQRGKLPLEEAAEYLLQALEAIAEAHAAGMVHRDLKPGNLFVAKGRDGAPSVKVLDFGISKVATEDRAPNDPLTHVSAMMGSPLYMSPEQMKAASKVDARSDIWSLGVIFYELLTGETPFQGDSLPEVCAQIVLDAEPPQARKRVPELPEAVDAIIARCLSRDLSARYQDANELARALAPFAPKRARGSVARIAKTLPPGTDLSSVVVKPSGMKTEPGKRAREVSLLRTLLLLGIGGALVVAALVSRTRPSPPESPSVVPPPAPTPAAVVAEEPEISGKIPAGAAGTKPPPPAELAPSPSDQAPTASAAPSASVRPPRPVRPPVPPPPATPETSPDFGGRH